MDESPGVRGRGQRFAQGRYVRRRVTVRPLLSLTRATRRRTVPVRLRSATAEPYRARRCRCMARRLPLTVTPSPPRAIPDGSGSLIANRRRPLQEAGSAAAAPLDVAPSGHTFAL